MKVKALAAALLVSLVAVSAAIAAPPPGKGKPAAPGQSTLPHGKKPAPTTPPSCAKPNVAVILTGTLANAPGQAALPFNLQITVKGSNAHGSAWKKAGSATVVLATSTKISRQGSSAASSLAVGDVVNVQARACKADLGNPAALPTLTASRVVAHPAKTS